MNGMHEDFGTKAKSAVKNYFVKSRKRNYMIFNLAMKEIHYVVNFGKSRFDSS